MAVDTDIIIKLLILAVFIAGAAGGLSVSLLNETLVKEKRLKERNRRIKENNKNKYKPLDMKI